MADTVIMPWTGFESGEAAAALYDKVHPTMMGLVNGDSHPGMISHVCSKAPDGLVIVDVWESAAAWQGLFADRRLGRRFRRREFPSRARSRYSPPATWSVASATP